MTEKDSLINQLTVTLAENFDVSIKALKETITKILQQYHVRIATQEIDCNNTDTNFLMKKFSEAKFIVGMSKASLSQYQIVVKQIEKTCNKKLIDIDTEDINTFLKVYGKTVSDVTLRGKFLFLSSVYNWLYSHKYINFNPVTNAEKPKATVIYKKPLSDSDFEKIKRACETLPEKESKRDTALVYFFASTGCRVSELKNIKLGDVDFEQKTCKVLGKGRKERIVFLNDKTLYRLRLYLNTRDELSFETPLFSGIRGKTSFLTKEGITSIIKKLGNIAGVQNLTCHVFRRFYATNLRKRNVNVQVIAKSLGHANLNQINRYSLYTEEEVSNAIRYAI